MHKIIGKIVVIITSAVAVCFGAGGCLQSRDRLDPAGKGPDGLPIIFWVIERENMDAVVQLLDDGADIEVKGFQQSTPVLMAALPDTWPIVLYLLERGANPKATSQSGITLAYLTANSRVQATGPYGEALAKVKVILKEHGLLEDVLHPIAVKQMMKDGTWPPAVYKD